MDTLISRRKDSIKLVGLLALLGILDMQLTHIFLTLGGDEGNNILFFSTMLDKDHTAGMLYMASCKLLGILLLLKAILMLGVIRDWVIGALCLTVVYYVAGITYSLDFIIYATYNNSLLYQLIWKT